MTIDPHDTPTRGLGESALPPREGTETPPTRTVSGDASPVGDLERTHRRTDSPSLGPRADPLAHTRIGAYLVIDPLGEGGMGRVYRAFDATLNRQVAIKVLHRDLESQQHARLVREAQAMAQLSHPNVVQVYEVGQHRGRAFVVMELVPGQTLRQWQRQDPRPSWQTCVRVYQQAGAGLAAAHEQGLVHRDFKPSNALVDPRGRVRVLDFGLVRTLTDPSMEVHTSGELRDELDTLRLGSVHLSGHGRSIEPLTEAGVVMGTPAYMAPEQLRGDEVDARSDQFSFCVSLYEAIYAKRPFVGRTLHEREAAIRAGPRPATPSDPQPPRALLDVLGRGLSFSPRDRWPSMESLLGELERLATPPRRDRWTRGALALGLVAMGAGLVYQAEVTRQAHEAEQSQRCSGSMALLSGVWDDARRDDVKAAIVRTDRAFADDTWARVRSKLDAYADAWAQAHTQACEATSIRHEQSQAVMDLRMQCLHQRKAALRAAVDVLAGADVEAMTHAIRVIDDIPALGRCGNVPWLEQRRQRLPPPEDPAVAQQVETLRQQLLAIQAQKSAGEVQQALEDLEPVIRQAEALGYGPTRAEAQYLRGDLREHNSLYEEAERDLKEALTLATEHRHDAVAADAVSRLTGVVGHRRGRYEEARGWAQVALALSRNPDLEPTVEATALNIVGNELLEQDKLDDALEHYRRALSIYERALGPEDPELARVLTNIGLTLQEQGKLDDALEHLDRALEIEEHALGPEHPELASVLINIGLTRQAQGKLDDALALYQRSLALVQQALGPAHPRLASSLHSIGRVLAGQGKHDGALDHYRRALALIEQARGPEHPDVAVMLINIGGVLYMRGELDDALDHYRRAMAITTRAFGEMHTEVGKALINIGLVRQEQGQLDQALDDFRRALTIIEQTLGPEHVNIAETMINMGLTLQAQGNNEEALERYRRAQTILARALGPTHPKLAIVLSNIAMVQVEQQELQQARDTYQRALAIFEQALGPTHPMLAYPLQGLAQIALERRDFDTARQKAQRALSIREASAIDPTLVAGSRFALARALWPDRAERPRARTLAQQARDAWATHGPGREDALAEVDAWLATHRARRRSP
ncbi:MAG: serine/threonine-protein kinase [Myxococcota bacterium]